MLEFILRILLTSSIVSGSQYRLKGGHFTTEDGKLYEIASLTTPQIEYTEKVLGCSLQCADLCLEVTRGTALLRCYKFCGCQDLITENSSKIQELATQAYFRDVRIDVDIDDTEIDKRKADVKITGPTDPATGTEPKIADIEYEVKDKGPNTIKREFEVEIPQDGGKDLEWKYEAETTYGEGFSDSKIEWKEPNKQWNTKGVQHEEHSKGYYSANTTYEVPYEKGYGTEKKGYEWKVDPNNTENGEGEVYWHHDYLSPSENKHEFVKADLKYESNHTDIKSRYAEITHRDEPKQHLTHPKNTNHSNEPSAKPLYPSIPYENNSSEDSHNEAGVDVDHNNRSSSENETYSEPKEWQGGVDYKYSMSWQGVESTSWYTPNLAASFINTLSMHCASKCAEICKDSEDKYSCLEKCSEIHCEKKVSKEGVSVISIVVEILLLIVIFTAVMLKLQRRKQERREALISPESRAYYHKL